MLGCPQNTEISCEDGAILTIAGFVSFISLFSGALKDASASDEPATQTRPVGPRRIQEKDNP